ncbi:hypothetical protein VNO77_18820 [Canavalia gladiata]|uniref:Uncharacterized protein n=1 Tax=Canavalia gladiata TaxID=3824 RepID=A0AAN9LQ79_CANGL
MLNFEKNSLPIRPKVPYVFKPGRVRFKDRLDLRRQLTYGSIDTLFKLIKTCFHCLSFLFPYHLSKGFLKMRLSPEPE